MLLAVWTVGALIAITPAAYLPLTGKVDLSLSVLLFAFGLSALTGVLTGLVPAWQAARVNLNEFLKEGTGRSIGGSRGLSFRGALVMTEIALGLIALAGAGLMIRSSVRMESVVSESTHGPRFRTLLMSVFGALALLLVSVGIYGVMFYTTAQRAREIAIRMAIGAQSRDALRLVISQGMKLALIGLLTGLAGALALTRLLRTLLFGVSPADPISFASITLLLAGVALLACLVPARRATKVDPMVVLRSE
ncbi:MAG: FtsX-like permease family protein [Chloracidobacterium sp.]|nr:FtsX-like permease family protein [Chloracidobacterium sp.]